ncbi:D-amino-acid transaminase [Cohnella pontilimi]|uniref:D-alanine aminotransferase n=1 Tax=Cohnella pontilimi TaxID=2564100 RepID=A0A4U0FHV0_9BACL|nr:D-amino-acid transaminase [Cohnella pontilimi]TJY44518.1 D-amino-acid transaminase [Cohnella pontilimi]
MSIYWVQGEFWPKEEIRVSPDDRGYLFGDGVYEMFRVYGGKLYEPKLHFERLERSAAGIRIPMPYSADELHERLRELIRRNNLQEGTVYIQITRGTAPRNHLFPKDSAPVTMAYCNELKRPLAQMEAGIRAVTVNDIRWLHCDYKTLNLLPNVLAKQEAVDRGGDDAILHRGEVVTECSASNVMIVSQGRLITHPANHLILHGVTRAVTLRLAAAAGIPVEERTFTLDELRAAEEVFQTGTTIEVMPVVMIDGQRVGDGQPGPVTRRLQKHFEATLGD